MYKQHSLTRLSSRSLSKLKTKIEVAFARHHNNQNQEKNMQQVIPQRSNSTKSLAKSKYQSADRNLPFSTAIKNRLMQTDRRSSAHQTPTEVSRVKQVVKVQNIQKKLFDQIECKHLIQGEKILGYSWFHIQGKELISVSKKSKQQNLRYFAMKESVQGKQRKKIIAAIEDGVLYVGNKKYILITSKMNKLFNKEDAQKVKLQNFTFALIVQESTINFTNLHKLVSFVFELIADGVKNIDTIINILGRKMVELMKKSNKQKGEQLFILIILLERDLKKLIKEGKND